MAASPSPPGEPKPLHRLHLWQIQAVRDLMVVLAVIGIVWFGHALRAVTVPLLVALLLAYLFEPLIRWLVKQPYVRMNRMQAVSTLLVSAGLIVTLFLVLAIPLVVGQTGAFIRDIRDGTMRHRIARLIEYVPRDYRDDFSAFIEFLPGPELDDLLDELKKLEALEDSGQADESSTHRAEEAPSSASAPPVLTEEDVRRIVREAQRDATPPESRSTGLLDAARGGMNMLASFTMRIIEWSLLAFLIPFYFFFFSLWFPQMQEFGRSLIPPRNRANTLELIERMDFAVAGFVRGRIVISVLMGIMFSIGWMICGVPYALPLGLLIGVFCAVPYLGGVGVPLAVGLLFFHHLSLPEAQRGLWLGWWGVIIWPSLVFVIVQIVESYLLTPIIAGKATNLDPVTIIVVVLAGGSLMGVYGMLLAIPIGACGKILLTDVLFPRIDAWLKGERDDPLPIE